MTKDDIISMARQVGIVTGENLKFSDGYRYRSVGSPSNVREQCLIDFAAKVASAEREDCAKVAEAHKWPIDNPSLHRTIAAAIRAKGQA